MPQQAAVQQAGAQLVAAVAGAVMYAGRADEGRSILDGILGRFFK